MRFDAVLFDRDGTLIVDVPYNGDPAAVRPVSGAAAAVRRLRAAGLRIGVVTNQSAVARGLASRAQVDAVNRRVDELLGGFDTWQVCPHDDTARCGSRKPGPGLVLAAARDLGVPAARCVVVGDIGSDVVAAQSAGAVGVLVPTPATRPSEVAAAPIVCADLNAAVDWILGGALPVRAPTPTEAPRGRRVLVVRADSDGDVLLTGPAIRAVAARAGHVTLLCGPRGRHAAELLPGVDEVVEWGLPWLDPDPPPVDPDGTADLVKRLAAGNFDEAVVVTSFHQSPLPLALLLRLAEVGRISAISVDYPGSLLDVRHAVEPGIPEAEEALSLVAAAGYPLPAGDDGALRIAGPLPDVSALTGPEPYVVLHPGASVPARACPPDTCAGIVAALAAAGRRVLVTGSPAERAITGHVAGTHGVDLGGRTTLRELAAILDGAEAVVVGNTGPAHLAAAVGTPVVSLYAPTVPFSQWGPYRVPTVRLGDQHAPCRDSRAKLCPVPGHPCLSTIGPDAVVAAVKELSCGS